MRFALLNFAIWGMGCVLAGPTRGSVAARGCSNGDSDFKNLEVDNAPSYLRPYIMRHYAHGQAVTIGAQTYRFYVTGPSSDYAFTLLSTNAPTSASYGVLPHIHERHYENFFNLKGRYQLWAKKGNSTQETRVIGPGDYGSVVRNTTHTFKILEPDTELIGAIVPGGFEDLFFAQGENFTNPVHTAYVPQIDNDTTTDGPDAATISSLESFDVYAQLNFTPRTDAVDGSAPKGSAWHTAKNELGAVGQPYFIANGWGPKYLNTKYGYHIVAPLATPTQTQDTNFTLSTISMSATLNNATVPVWTFPDAAAFQVLEGKLTIQIDCNLPYDLTIGDVAFIPGGVPFKYWSDSYFTKVFFLSSGHDGLDQKLIASGEPYEYVTFPVYW